MSHFLHVETSLAYCVWVAVICQGFRYVDYLRKWSMLPIFEDSSCEKCQIRLIPTRRLAHNHFEHSQKGGSPEKKVRYPKNEIMFLHSFSISLKWHIRFFLLCSKNSISAFEFILEEQKLKFEFHGLKFQNKNVYKTRQFDMSKF